MAATTANVQNLKETENTLVLKVVGTGAETFATLVDASTYTGATGLINTLNIGDMQWSVNSAEVVTLQWANGATGLILAKLSGNGAIHARKNFNTKLVNGATGAAGDIMVTSTSGNYTLMLSLEKDGVGWTKVGSYN